MHVYEISVTFGRKRQPKDYESANTELGAKVAFDEGEDWRSGTQDVLTTIQRTVYEALGLQAAAQQVEQRSQTPQPTPAPPPPAPEDDDEDGDEDIPIHNKPQHGRGTPWSPQARQKAEDLNVDIKKIWENGFGTGKEGRVTMGDVEAYAKKTTGSWPNQSSPPPVPPQTAGIPDEQPATFEDELAATEPEAASEETVDDVTLQKVASDAARKIGGAKVIELMKQFGAARLMEIPQAKRKDFLRALEEKLQS